MFTDTHCHIFKEDYENQEEILKNLNINNIKRIIINGYNDKTNKEVINLTKKYKNVYGTLGFHPNNINELMPDSLKFIEENINKDKILGIGEIGLDYYRNKENKEKQKELLIKLLNLATTYNKPVIIHNRESTDDLLKLLKEYNLKGIIHSFSGSYETAIEFIKLGYKLGINGIVTFKNSKLPETLSKIPLENILLETDSPYITPEPIRGKQNEPKNLIYIANKLTDIYNTTLEELSIQLEKNYKNTFSKVNKN